jgi:FKBP-type peptidyl-prolyl cis-trans isomerase
VSFFWDSLRAAMGRSRSPKALRAKKGASRRRRDRRQFESLEIRALMTSVAGDFNGDGVADLAIGIPAQMIGAKANAGGVQILYGTPLHGTPAGLTSNNQRLFTRDSAGLSGASTAGDKFGQALAVGDFNGDRIDDLAIGVPGMNGGAGGVYILLGTRKGLKSSGAQLWTENSPGINGVQQSGANFGAALATGDFNRDHTTDLAIGAPKENIAEFTSAGAVHVIYNNGRGLRSTGDQMWDQDNLGSNGAIAANNLFGSALAAGDFDADGYRDLAIGAPGQTIKVSGTDNASAGQVNIMYGTRAGLGTANNQKWIASDLQGIVNIGAEFGFSLSTGDINNDSRSDLAIGSPGENIPAVGSAAAKSIVGAVHVMLGGSSRLTATGNQIFHENTTGIATTPLEGDRFGDTVAFGRLNSDRTDDLAITVPGATVSTKTDAGSIRLLFSTGTALGTTGSQLITQNTSGVIGFGADDNEKFGSSIAVGDFNNDGLPDIAVETPGEVDLGGASGTANILFGTGNGIGTTGNQMWMAASRKLLNTPAETTAQRNQRLGDEFLATNKTDPDVHVTSSGLQYKILSSGDPSGPTGTVNSNFTVNYTGTHLDGTVFDSSASHGGAQTFSPSGGLIAGFTEALLLMHPGDHWTIWIPSNIAYGAAGQGNIGPNETLTFDLEVVSIA